MTDPVWIAAGCAALLGSLCLALLFALARARQHIAYLSQQQEQETQQRDELLGKLSAKEVELNRLHAGLGQLRSQEQQLRAQLSQQQDQEQRLSERFENLANRIFEQKQQSFLSRSHKDMDAVLAPLKQQMEQFRQQVAHSHTEEAKQRHALEQQLRDLKQLNVQMSEDALNLTRALKGDNKIQGNWGEVVLTRLLEQSGLKAGREYEIQASLQQEDGKRYQPDVIIHLPDGKDVVVDAKMSLNAYERYYSSDDPAERERALDEHVASVRGHIKGLGQKDYHKLKGLRSLDYVLMFIPVEPAFLAAIDRDPSLISDALSANILLISPTNLLVALRTIQNLWRFEHQNQNAVTIAQQAGKLYDKLVGFSEDLQKLGRALDTAQGSYQNAMNKFSEGRGNLLRQGEQLRQLGVESSKQPDAALLKQALEAEE
ncbi:DNA recombination protein RmuC [Ferrimonas marina]|uniref:DNA recombination protein RmuC n=1 Tax=Ferrimonas marina TaxID=299255 RepID=A0A1M5R6L7_9GAMM|nr:DNA recombination protein RmuC [Ferrimonas marina]SHH21821.1 DNA recombination protein RmuC [Ferrimonas marina]